MRVVPLSAALFGTALLLCGATSCHRPRGDGAGESAPIPIKVNYSPYVSFGPLLIAMEEGFFAEEGLDVEFVLLRRGPVGVPSLAQGDLDVLAGALNVGLLNAIARGANVRIVADKGYIAPDGCAYIAIVGRPDLLNEPGWDSPGSLRRLRIVCAKDSFSAFMLDRVLGRYGLGLHDGQTRYLPPAAMGEAMRKGTVDLASATEPWLTRIVSAGDGVVWMRGCDVAPGFQLTHVSFGPSILERRPEAGRRFMIAYLRGVRQYEDGKTERNLDILEKHTGLDRDLLQQACWPAFRPDRRIDVDSVMEFQTWALGQGLLDRALSPEEFWEPDFVDEALRVLDGRAESRGSD